MFRLQSQEMNNITERETMKNCFLGFIFIPQSRNLYY